MAKAKASAPLTPEEKLAAALVPKNEQPYPVPENWCWVRLGNLTDIIGGGTPSTAVKEYYDDGEIPWITPADLSNFSQKYISRGSKNITQLGLAKSSARLLPKNTVLLTTRAPIGYVAIAKNELSTNQGFKSFIPSPNYIPEYLYWYLFGNTDLLTSNASGTTFLELSKSRTEKIPIPLPPLPEQQRIVERIERMFAKLDAAKTKLEFVTGIAKLSETIGIIDTMKKSILARAFRGLLATNDPADEDAREMLKRVL